MEYPIVEVLVSEEPIEKWELLPYEFIDFEELYRLCLRNGDREFSPVPNKTGEKS
jgi:hypothetical protein